MITGVGAIAVLAGGTLSAGDYGKAVVNDKMPIEDKSFCEIFKKSTLYEGDGFIRKVKFKGRYQGQWISQTEDDTLNGVETTNGYHEYEHRRFRLGAQIEMANDLTLVASMNISDGSGGNRVGQGHGLTRGVFFDDWDELYVEWAPSKEFYVLTGKAKQKITMENETSSNDILTIERSAISNSVISSKPWGVAVGFKALGLSNEVGAWIAGADRDGDTRRPGEATGERWDIGDTDSRGSLTYRGKFDISEQIEGHFDYQFTNNSDGRVNPRGRSDVNLGSTSQHVIAFGTKSEFGELGLITDLIYAGNNLAHAGSAAAGGAIPAGYDTWGLVIKPYYDITDQLQFVARYAYMDEGQEQRTQRWDRRQNVENYHTFYAGLNYYVCENNLKVMAGYEYATGDVFGVNNRDVTTGTWMLGVRTSF